MTAVPIVDSTPVEVADLVVLANELEVHPYWHLRVAAPPTHLQAKPGQFFHLLCPGSPEGDPFLRRPMSVYSIDREAGEISFLYKVGGIGTAGLATLKAGDTINALGPLGVGFSIPDGSANVLIVARGVGLATMAPLAASLHQSGASLTTICSYRDRLATVGDGSFDRFGTVIRVYDTDGSSAPADMAARVRQLHSSEPITMVYTCGSKRIMRLLQGLSTELAIPGEVAVEQRMACGLGMCHACVVDVEGQDGDESVRVCTDGPVFPLGAIK